jgi:hypothetical protein
MTTHLPLIIWFIAFAYLMLFHAGSPVVARRQRRRQARKIERPPEKVMIIEPPVVTRIRPVPHPAEITTQRFAEDGSHVWVTTADGTRSRHEVLTPAMRDVVRQMAALRKDAHPPPHTLTLSQMWEMLDQPGLAARERELERLTEQEASLKRSLEDET